MAEHTFAQKISAVFRNVHDAAAAYMWLRSRYDENHISVLLPDKNRDAFHLAVRDHHVDSELDSTTKTEASGAAGVVMGAGLFALAGLALSGVGLLVAGPLAAALAGGAAGAMVGGLYGGLVGLGFPEDSARAYEKAIQEGAIAIVIMTHNDQEVRLVTKRFQSLRGEHIITV
jgi:uncharacterized membrane protein